MWAQQTLPPFSGDKVRVGLVGAGFVSQIHLRAIKSIPRAQLVGVADIIPERAEQRAKQFGIPRHHASLEQLLEEEFDVLHVTTPSPTHYELCLLGLQAGRHILVEKSFTETTDESDHLIAEAEKRGLRIMVDHSLLGDPQVVAGHRMLRRGAIGEINSIQIFRCARPPARVPERVPYFRPGDPIREIGVHVLYCLTSILGPVVDATYRIRRTGKTRGLLSLDEWTISVECERGLGQIHFSWNGPSHQVMNVRGERGEIQIDLSSGLLLKRTNWPGPKHVQLAINPLLEAAASTWQIGKRVLSYVCGRARWYQGIYDLIHTYYGRLLAGSPMPFDYEEVRNIVHWVDVLAQRIENDAEDYEITAEKTEVGNVTS